MDRAKAQMIIDEFAKTLIGSEDEGLYIGKRDGLHIFFIKRKSKGHHLGSPNYFGVDSNGECARIHFSDTLTWAMKRKIKLYPLK